MHFPRMPIEEESPEQLGYDKIKFNLTESSVRDRTLADLNLDLGRIVLAYTDHAGHPPLRALIAARAGGGLDADNVLMTAGAAAALFIVAISLLDAGDHIVVVRPNYATNIETASRHPLRHRSYIDLDFDQGFAFDIDKLKTLVRLNTKLISVTTPHNPIWRGPQRQAAETDRRHRGELRRVRVRRRNLPRDVVHPEDACRHRVRRACYLRRLALEELRHSRHPPSVGLSRATKSPALPPALRQGADRHLWQHHRTRRSASAPWNKPMRGSNKTTKPLSPAPSPP